MIAPLVPYAIRGAIWYQGESNVGRGSQYQELFPAMIGSWRERWGQGAFPFYFVQIAPFNFNESYPGAAAELREAQLAALRTAETGMAVTMDIGNPINIHPANKQDVGRRLSLWALAKTYGRNEIVHSGPLLDRLEIRGSRAIVHFNHAGGGLMSKGGPVTHLEIAGDDGVFVPARGRIEGSMLVVTSPDVSSPAAVRYAWGAAVQPNLFNKEGLPASPFRTQTLGSVPQF
jgi:sialate O-acetylesterase